MIWDGVRVYQDLRVVLRTMRSRVMLPYLSECRITHVIENRDRFVAFSEHNNGNNSPRPKSYYAHTSRRSTRARFIIRLTRPWKNISRA